MSEKQTDFWALFEAVITELKGMEYMDSTLAGYRRLYARLGSFMKDHFIKEYSPSVGKAFIAEYYPCNTDRRKKVLLIIKRLDDYLNNTPYRCHHAMKTPDIPPVFAGLLDDYQEYCISIGNRIKTVNKKEILLLDISSFSLGYRL